jgi:hypothetical protein
MRNGIACRELMPLMVIGARGMDHSGNAVRRRALRERFLTCSLAAVWMRRSM